MVERLIAGDSREWVVNVKEHFQCLHPDAEPTAFIRTAAGCLVKVPAKRCSDTVRIELSPEASEKLPEGESILLMQMTYGDSYRKTVALRDFRVIAAMADKGFDHRTEAQKCLAQAKAALADYTKGGSRVKSYTIGTRNLTYNSAKELMDLVEYWEKQVYLECCRRRGIDPRRMHVEFVS